MTSLLNANTCESLHQGWVRVASQELSTHNLELRPETRQEVVETVSLLVSTEPHTARIGPTDIRPQRVKLTPHLRQLLVEVIHGGIELLKRMCLVHN